MINIERPINSPVSLQTQAIRNYLNRVVIWKNDPTTLPVPDKNVPEYRTSDLIEAFDNYFFAKCYLTEQKFTSSYLMDVEHFHPKNFDAHPELRYEWTNLYPADHNANMSKPRLTPEGGYLDPCNPNDNVETEILYDSSFGNDKCFFTARNPANLKAINTADLLTRIHNGHNYESKIKTKELRFAIFKHKNYLLKLVINWQDALKRNNEEDVFMYSNRLKELLSRKSAFTMLLRSTPTVRNLIPKEFLD
jgi:hypothetical protein